MAEVREGMNQEEEITEEEMVFTPREKPVLGETSEMGTGLLVDAMSQITDQLRDVSERLRELEQVQQPSSRPNTLPINTVVSPPMSPTLDPNPSSVSVVPPQQTASICIDNTKQNHHRKFFLAKSNFVDSFRGPNVGKFIEFHISGESS
ncbi:hypothetical protein Pcinc_020082 [Petrolisthes cinctipes]|uniref:Uncharacterized protein n=1 Tax=Petrolisthes cinctipes TaxID=88211 RepID=A0AAE1FK07_PETCI|nr:hypothetical protein Pcinc_020082 [Petrolisthes cinctipes]